MKAKAILEALGVGYFLIALLIEIGPLRPPRNPPFRKHFFGSVWKGFVARAAVRMAQSILRSEEGRDLTLGLVV